jgi:DNA-binding HxlR family transcriptional regulator
VPRRRPYASYNDGCAAAHALDIVGERWALLVVRELLLGPKRFSDLQRDVIGISATALTQRLRDLEREGVLEQQALPAPARVPVYRLTPWGRQLEYVIAALSGWGAQSSRLPRDADMSPDTVILAMRAHARPDPTRKTDLCVDIRLVDARNDGAPPAIYIATLRATECSIRKADAEQTEISVSTDSRTWQHLLFGRTSLAASIQTGQLVLSPHNNATRRDVQALLHACSPQDPQIHD